MENTQKTLVKPLFKHSEGTTVAPMPPRKSAEEKMYILLIMYNDESRQQTFYSCLGRTDATRDGKYAVQDGANLNDSRVLLEGKPIEDSVNLYWFMKKMQGIIVDPDFDIDDFMVGDPDELVSASTVDMPEQYNPVYTDNNTDVDDDSRNV